MPAVRIRPQQDLIYLERMGAASARKHAEREKGGHLISRTNTKSPIGVGSGGGGRSPGNRWERLRQVLLAGVRRPSGVRNLAAKRV
jgi:hypothetical protein